MCAMETEWQTVKTKHATQDSHAKADRKPKQKTKSSNGHNLTAARRKSRDLRASFSKDRAKPDLRDQQESGNSSDEEDNSPDPIDQPVPPYHVSTIILCPLQQCPVSEPFLDTTALVTHFRNEHHLVFANLHHMYMALEQYISRWAKELESKPVSEFGKKENNDSDVYIIDPEHCALDKEIREQMQRRKLEEVLNIQQRERDVDAKMKRKCLFCKIVCENRTTLFKHMFSEHNFNIGLPDNLVNVNEFLDVLEGKLAKLQCLYCEKIFTSAPVLRKHMRKKKHFKIAPKNRQYDRFYVINYLEPGKNWEHFERDNGDSEDEKRDDSWADWEEEESEPTMCLFDDEMLPTPKDALEHMKSVHSFDLTAVREAHNLDFYKTVVLINYIRHQSSLNKCFACGHTVDDFSQLAPHMKEKGCFTKPLPKDAEYWKDPKYLLPTYENDPILTGFEDDKEFEDDVRLPDDEANRKYLSEVMSESLAISDRIAAELDEEEENEDITEDEKTENRH